ncbi:protein spire homolog 1-like [Argiope bruennichi]|uniref:protein spire homolog 1-like n=1 Tax=Argiope bruennichi TaxID=94029 RepID=UPI002494952B|nr:protein spire homolog 1-like [Argiope bruennichi]
MAGDCKKFSRCSLDSNGCLRLSTILQSFSAALSEEQAWAVCFQAAKCMVNEWNSDSSSCYCLSDTSHLLIHKDGYVHRSSVKLSSSEAGKRQLATSEYQLVATLGMIIFSALDYLNPRDEERNLSRPLESLIEKMTSTSLQDDEDEADSSSQNADEGIEQDSGEDDHILHSLDDADAKHRRGISLIQVIELCANHLPCPEDADCHYKAVCRALVAEILELTTFLENISNRTKILTRAEEDEMDSRTLEKLRIQDWARLWMQVIHQLRQGVKLKKVESAQSHSIEYALTPYEMLLDDIRSRRYKLRQVMVNGDIPPRVKKDAHALILEFIRSRPPLVPVSKRKLPPTPPRQLSLYEKLMASIKQQHKLKPTVPSNGDCTNKRKIETSRTKLEETDETPQPQRRLIKADINLGLSSSFEDLDDIPQTPPEEHLSLPMQNENRKSCIVRSNSQIEAMSRAERRHSISVCESPPRSGDQTPQEGIDPHFSGFYEQSSQAARSDYWKSSQWQSLECLSLTLEEVVHIRNVLTKAELESLIVDPVLYEDIRKGKVCFTCKQIRFSFFGPWGVKCKMCERTVCDKCSSKMRIPTEHFARIPVYMLSPTPSPPPEEESSHSFWKFSDVFGKSEVKENIETTPKLSRQKTTVENGYPKRKLQFRHSESVQAIATKKGRNSLPPTSSSKQKRPPLQRSKTLVAPEAVTSKSSSSIDDKMKGPLVAVCRECKVMVCNIIMASQDKVSYDQKRRKNSKTWPQKRGSTNTSMYMDTVTETPPSSPDDIFASDSRKKLTP